MSTRKLWAIQLDYRIIYIIIVSESDFEIFAKNNLNIAIQCRKYVANASRKLLL